MNTRNRINFEEIKRSVSLKDLLTQAGAQFKKRGIRWRSDNCPFCGEGSKNRGRLVLKNDLRYECYSCGSKGDVIDAYAQLNGVSKVQAAKQLSEENFILPAEVIDNLPATENPEPEVSQEKVIEVVETLFRQRLKPSRKILDYFARRGISKTVLVEAYRQGVIGFLPDQPDKAKQFLLKHIGEQKMKETLLWQPKKQAPAAIFRPIMTFLWEGEHLQAVEFRHIAGNPEVKSLRFGPGLLRILLRGDGKTASVVEGLPDTLSLRELGYSGDIIGLTSATAWNVDWAKPYEGIYICLDPDKAGRIGKGKIKKSLNAIRKPWKDRSPEEGDINDRLKKQRGLA